MTETLFTFLGRSAKGDGGYRTTTYTFSDGTKAEPAAFLGWKLAERLAVKRLVILGTPGSMWDHLFTADLSIGSSEEEAQEALYEAVEHQCVQANHLAPIQAPLSAAIGCDVRLVLIPYARDADEQAAVLEVMSQYVDAGETVDLDITHGYRHLPMLGLLAALYLRRVRAVTVGHIWYGEYDPSTGEAPVRDLVGLLGFADWIEALAIYDHTRDYSAFAPLVGTPGEHLRKAAFHERTTNSVKAREQLSTWTRLPDRLPPERPEASLFAAALDQRLSWWRSGQRADQELNLAKIYLEGRDYVRSAIYAYEAVITAEVMAERGRPSEREDREAASDRLRNTDSTLQSVFTTLNRLRNALAHGTLASGEQVRRILEDETSLTSELSRLISEIERYLADNR